MHILMFVVVEIAASVWNGALSGRYHSILLVRPARTTGNSGGRNKWNKFQTAHHLHTTGGGVR